MSAPGGEGQEVGVNVQALALDANCPYAVAPSMLFQINAVR
jgi:hypothetical protein